METIEATLFISVVIIAITQMVKMALPKISGFVTILVAFAVGIIVALVDGAIGLEDISIAGGIMAALGAIGITTAASKAGGGAPGDEEA